MCSFLNSKVWECLFAIVLFALHLFRSHFKLEHKIAGFLKHELVCIQLRVGSKEHIKALYFSYIKYMLMSKILKDRCDRSSLILVYSLQPIPAVICQPAWVPQPLYSKVAVISWWKDFFFQRMNSQTSQQYIHLSMTAITRGRTGFALFFVPEVGGKWISLFPGFTKLTSTGMTRIAVAAS